MFVALVIFSARSHASCGAASCPINNYHYLKAGWVGLNIVHEYIDQNQIYVGSSKSFVGAIPEEHDEVHTLNERNVLQAQFGLIDNLGVKIDVPFIHREHSHIHHYVSGSEFESWDFSGLGDVALTGSYELMFNDDASAFTFLGGVKFPTGVTDAKNGSGEEAEVTIQPGTGSTDEVIGLHYRQTLASVPTFSGQYSALPLNAGLIYQTNGKGTNDYRVGNILLAHIATGYQFEKRASLLLQVNGKFQGYADVGLTDEPRENTGGTWIFLSPGLDLHLSDAFAGTAYVQFPLYQNVHGIQQTASFNLLFSIGYSFDLNEE